MTDLTTTWHDDGDHAGSATAIERVNYISIRPWKAVIRNKNTNGVTMDASLGYDNICTFQDLQIANARNAGLKSEEDSTDYVRMIADHCWIHHCLASGINTSKGTKNNCVIHRCLVEYNGLNYQNWHGIYNKDKDATNHAKIQNCLVANNASRQIHPFDSATVYCDITRTVIAGGMQLILFDTNTTYTQSRNTHGVPNWYLQGHTNGDQSYATHESTSASYMMARDGMAAQAWANGKLTYASEVVEDSGSYYHNSLADHAGNATRTTDGAGLIAADTIGGNQSAGGWNLFPSTGNGFINPAKRFWWPDADPSGIGAYEEGPALADSLQYFPHGMYSRNGCWARLPWFPTDLEFADTANGQRWGRSVVDLKIDGATGTGAGYWNYNGDYTKYQAAGSSPTTGNYASFRLAPCMDDGNRWGIKERSTTTIASGYDFTERPLTGHTTSNSYIELTATRNANHWDLALLIKINGVSANWTATGVHTGPWGDVDTPTFLPLTYSSGDRTFGGSAVIDLSSATLGFCSQKS